LRLAACFLSITMATAAVGYFEDWKTENNLFWVANGLLLAYLLLAPRWRWPAYLVTGFLALSLRILFLPEKWDEFLLYNLLDIVEVTMGALLLRRRSLELPRFTQRAYLFRFVACAVLAGPILAGAVYALALALLRIPTPAHPFLNWAASDSLGIAISTPAFVAIFQTRLRDTVYQWRHLLYPVVLLAVAIAAFTQHTVPLFFLVFPLLVLVLVRLGLGFASLCTFLVAAIAGWFTINHQGLFAAAGALNPVLPGRLLQSAAASAIFLIYTVSVVMESQRATEQRLREIVTLHNLVSDNSRDAIILSDFTGHRSYASAAVERLVGWTGEEFASIKNLDLLHPEDLPRAAALVRELRSGSDGATIQCRVRKRSGEYVWVEASLRVVRDPRTGMPSSILNIVRDISERKRAERQLQDAYKAVEALAVTDALTGLANRRRFDQCLSSEWRRGLRDPMPLSMLLIDADLFKSYNDTYGHVRGDSCLKQIAEAAQDVIVRPGDLVARFGGEEFAVILPSTGSEGALRVAQEVCEALRGRKLPHSGNPFGIMTVSVGCATMIPSFGQHSVALIERADAALYQAKRSGRNRVCAGTAACGIEEDAQTPAPLAVLGGKTA
jgi:diguanylate cyclase (GGDEF)-like protein/PAS domain S-box-containing protein